MNHHCRVTHCLRRSIGPVIFICPVEHAHAQKLEEDVIHILPWDATTRLFADPDHVPPQDIVAMHLGQGVVDPLVVIKAFYVWSIVQHPNGDLEFPSKSADKLCHTSERKDLVVVRVCPHPPTHMADAMLALVFPGNLQSTWNHERCAGQKDLATKDRVATVELVSYEWYCHWCRRRVVERIVGKQVEQLIGSADDSAIERSNLL